MGTGQDVRRGSQSFGGVGGSQHNQAGRIASQFQKTVRADPAIFQGFVIRPHPEQWLAGRHPDGQAGGKASGAPVAGMDFMQGPGQQSTAQSIVGPRHTQTHERTVRGQPGLVQGAAQIRQFFLFVHVMFQCDPTPAGSQAGAEEAACKSVMLRRNW